MKLDRPRKNQRQESTIALINIVFLMLIFFLVAGTLAPPMEKDIALIETQAGKRVPPPQTLALRADGILTSRGSPTTLEEFFKQRNDIDAAPEIMADRNAPAAILLGIASEMQVVTGKPVRIITRRIGE